MGHDLKVGDENPVDVALAGGQGELLFVGVFLGDAHDHEALGFFPSDGLVEAFVVFVLPVAVPAAFLENRSAALVAQDVLETLIFTGFHALPVHHLPVGSKQHVFNVCR